MDIYYLGHSSFKIKGRSAVVITDPFDPAVVGQKYSKTEADIVTISHQHPDHNKTDLVLKSKMIISEAGEYEIMGVSVIGIQVDHDSKEGKERGKNNIYILEIDGVRVAHLGDLGHKLSDKIVEQMGDVDVLMIPVGGTYTIGPTEACEIVKEFEPPYVLPMHFGSEGKNEKLLPAEDFLKECGYEVEKYDKLILKKDLINYEQTKIVMLEKR